MNICLCMIVRDAEKSIARCLESAKPFISSYVIIDTGSVDRTIETIRETLLPLDGSLTQSEWVNFGHNRSELMARAKGAADYLLLLDADMVLHYDHGDLPPLHADVYNGTIRSGSMGYALPLFVRGDRNWRYEGVAHSYLACDFPWEDETLPGLWIEDHSHTTVEKLHRDLKLLSEELARKPLDARTAFYLAQTYADLDMFPEAIATYRYRANLDGWDEETFYARFKLGCLLSEHVSFNEGARELLAAWEMRPHRIEPLRVLANVANNIADKYPVPKDKLFVGLNHYAKPEPEPTPLPPQPSLAPGRVARKNGKAELTIDEVAAVIVTRGNVDLGPILAILPFEQTVIWDNSKSDHDYKAFGRFVAIPETTKPVIYFQDDDVIFTEFDKLLAEYEPGKAICNMDDPWIDACGYRDKVCMTGAGSLCDRHIPAGVFKRYFAQHPWDEDALVEADFIFGVLAPFKVIDIGYEAREFADAPDRLYTQPWQPKRKWEMIERCLAMK